ncbi:ABC transporter permease [Niabella hibiscisoli]|uniref:ABC transporter permease n=1 Tax=Niabella hibiscisoli TaxID=1825928 RepID=UPI001F0DFF16|nr:hypothetical protein [Niabella hibiscisoli]MCH5718652.1 hypothetical protein [Niabella hibiscisoli]
MQINDHTDFASVSAKIQKVRYNKVAERNKRFKSRIFLHPMKDWHLRSSYKEGVQSGGQIEYVWMFAIIGAFVLLLACINFMNLSTARSEKEQKKLGSGKQLGHIVAN